MPSIVTKDDVIDQLYLLGIKNPKAIATAVRTIDFYSVALARRYAEPVVVPQAPQLAPGQSDQDAKVTCCTACDQVKAWSLFPYSPKSDTKHTDTCKKCSPTTQVPRDPQLEIECSGCGTIKNADNHFRRSSSRTGYRAHCRDCEGGRLQCADCGRTRFPRDYIAGSKTCVYCLAEKYIRRTRKKKVAA